MKIIGKNKKSQRFCMSCQTFHLTTHPYPVFLQSALLQLGQVSPPHKRKPLRIIPADLHRLETFPTVSKHSMELTTCNNQSSTTSSPDLLTESQRHGAYIPFMSDTANSVLMRRVDQLCYVDDLLEAGRGCDLSVTAIIRRSESLVSTCEQPIHMLHILCLFSFTGPFTG